MLRFPVLPVVVLGAAASTACADDANQPREAPPASLSQGVGSNDPTVSSPVIVATHAQLTQSPLGASQLDGPLAAYPGGQYWLGSHYNYGGPGGGIKHALVFGGVGSPYSSVAWYKETCVRGPGYFCVPGTLGAPAFTDFAGLTDVIDLWFTNLYHAGGSEYLAFIHEERVGFSGGVSGNFEGKTRIGLARSADGGNTWKYLGRIVSPHGDPEPFNIQGAPYVVNGNHFYVYFVDRNASGAHGIGVARADVNAVLDAARTCSPACTIAWQKRDASGGWTSAGLGGPPGFPTNVWGITHTQAARSTHDGKFYLPLTVMTWGGGNTSVKLYRSNDGLAYTPFLTLVDEGATTQGPSSGYQYCSVVDDGGLGNAQVGQRFHVYCMKFSEAPVAGSKTGLYRWTINLGPHDDYFRQSTDFSSTQGPRWLYRYGASFTDMTFASGVWRAPPDATNLITQDGFHPGATENPALTWIAPKAGSVRISGTVRDADRSCGDGGSASIVHNSTALFGQFWQNGDTVGFSHDITRSVAPGDGLAFMVGKGPGSNHCDYTIWDPSVEYQ